MATIFDHQSEFTGQVFEHLHADSLLIREKEFTKCVFKKCSFRMATFGHVTFTDCEFVGCDLSVLKVPNSRFIGVRFRDSKITGVNWTMIERTNSVIWFSDVSFENCDIGYANFTGLSLKEMTIDRCKAHEVDFTEVDLSKAILTNCEFDGARFVSANLTHADLRGSSGYAIDVLNAKVKGMTVSFPEGMVLLKGLGVKIDGLMEG